MRVPNVEKTMAILAFIRQIFADHRQDGLFAATCEVFEQHCGDSGKVVWMNERLTSFANKLNAPTHLLDLGGRSHLDVLNMFLYGAGLMHAKPHSRHREDNKLADAIREFGRERVVTAFHFTLHSVMAIPLSAYKVIRKEFGYWLAECELEKPSRVQLAGLFASVKSEPDRP
jgi:hypothetical protein